MATRATATKDPETKAEAPELAPQKAEIVPAAAPPLELAPPPSPEEMRKLAERQIQIRKAYVQLVARELRPDDVLVFGGADTQEVYIPSKPCRDILSWARVHVHMGPMTENRYGSPDGEFIIFEVTAKLTDGTGREVDVVGNRSTRDDFFGMAGKEYVCPLCKAPITWKKLNETDKYDSSVCATHGKVKSETVRHYLPLHDVDIASVRLSAVTNLYNHAVKAIGLMPTLKDLADNGMDVSKVKRVDFQSAAKQEKPPATQGSQRTTLPSNGAKAAQAAPARPSQGQPAAPPPQAATNGHTETKRVKGPIETIVTRAASGEPLRTGKGSQFVKVYVYGQMYCAFDNAEVSIDGRTKMRLFEILAQAKPGQTIDFIEEVSEVNNAIWHNIKKVLQIGNLEWDESTGLPVIRRDPPTDQRMPDWPANNPDVDDSDVPF